MPTATDSQWVQVNWIPTVIGRELPPESPGVPPYEYDLPAWTLGPFGVFPVRRKRRWRGKRWFLVHLNSGMAVQRQNDGFKSIESAKSLGDQLLAVRGAKKFFREIEPGNFDFRNKDLGHKLYQIIRNFEEPNP